MMGGGAGAPFLGAAQELGAGELVWDRILPSSHRSQEVPWKSVIWGVPKLAARQNPSQSVKNTNSPAC